VREAIKIITVIRRDAGTGCMTRALTPLPFERGGNGGTSALT